MHREELYRAMNPPGKRPHSAVTQLLTILLNDMAESMPEGYVLGFDIADDTPIPLSGGRTMSNLDLHERSQKNERRRKLRSHAFKGNENARENWRQIPSNAKDGQGHHILIEVIHTETQEIAHHWVDREELAAAARAYLANDNDPLTTIEALVMGEIDVPDGLRQLVRAHVTQAEDKARTRVLTAESRSAKVIPDGGSRGPRNT